MFSQYLSKSGNQPTQSAVMIKRQNHDGGVNSAPFYAAIRVVDSGGHADILAVKFDEGEHAVKRPKQYSISSRNTLKPVQRELNFFKKALKHENIISCLGFCWVNLTPGCIIMPLLKESLFDRITSRDGLVGLELFDLAKQLLCSLKFLHTHGIAHLDLKAENVMLEQVGDKTVAKLIDFGLFSEVTEREGSTRGSVDYVSPEMFALPFNEVDVCQSDMWSLAVVLFAMIHQEIIGKILLRKLKRVLVADLLTTQLDKSVTSAVVHFVKEPDTRAMCHYLVQSRYSKISLLHNHITNAISPVPNKDHHVEQISSLCISLFQPQGKRLTATDALKRLENSEQSANAMT